MKYSLTHVADQVLLRDLAALVARDRTTTAAMLAHIAEVDDRKLYLPAAHPSMFAYCVNELGLCEQAAFKRIRAARTARRFPEIFEAIADGRLHLSAVVALTPFLNEHTAGQLVEAAARKSMAEVERLLADRFPRPDVPTLVRPVPSSPGPALEQLSSRTVGTPSLGSVQAPTAPASGAPPIPNPVPLPALGHVESPAPRPRVTPLAPRTFAVQFTMCQGTHDKLRYAQELLSHQLPSGDVAEVFDRALDALIRELEKQRFAATEKPRKCPGSSRARCIPSDIKRAVWKRDGGRCTFVSESGRRCESRKFLEFDHVTEVARGGTATAAHIRLRCRAHNQYTAERTFGVEFMRQKREAATGARAVARIRNAATPAPACGT